MSSSPGGARPGESDKLTALRAAVAATDDVEAMYQIGLCYYWGNEGAPRDRLMAGSWWRQSTDAGHAPSTTMLARLFYHGEGVTQNFAQARALFGKAADKGDGNALFMLGVMHEKGEAAPVNLIHALACYKQADAAGFSSKTQIARVDAAINRDPKGALKGAEEYMRQMEPARYTRDQSGAPTRTSEEAHAEAKRLADERAAVRQEGARLDLVAAQLKRDRVAVDADRAAVNADRVALNAERVRNQQEAVRLRKERDALAAERDRTFLALAEERSQLQRHREMLDAVRARVQVLTDEVQRDRRAIEAREQALAR